MDTEETVNAEVPAIDEQASDTLPVDMSQLAAELDVGYEYVPEKAILTARQHREQIIPHLIQSIRDAINDFEDGEYPELNYHIVALHLLTEFKAKDALPVIIESMLLPDEGPFELYGDFVAEYFSRILAELAKDDLAVVEAIVANRDADPIVRAEAVSTYLYLVRDGVMTREDAVKRLHRHLREAIANRDELVSSLVSELYLYSPREAMEDIQEAFRLNLVDSMFIRITDIEKSLSGGEEFFKESLRRCRPTGIADTIEELKPWYFNDDEPKEVIEEDAAPDRYADDLEPFEYEHANHESAYNASTIVNEKPKIGRNEPCHCGSGKKYKKCCGRN